VLGCLERGAETLEHVLTTYYFDIRDSGRLVRGTVGIDLSHDALAIHEATLIVWQLLSDASAESRVGHVAVSIRTETGACIYEASTSPANE
jgi:hypothetical protein